MGVVGVKTGVKAWSDKPNLDTITKSDNVQTISASDKDKVGQEELGAMLNKIADPNWVDPSKKMRAVGSDKLDKDAFMKLMLSQMKNQDPTNPLKSHEMAAQLAQFTSVEQMMNMNQTLTELKNAQKPQEGFQALNFIGKAVSGDSAKLVRMKGDKDHDFTFVLGEDARDMDIRIRDANGDAVRTVSLHDLKQGENRFSWNGQDDRGHAMPAGEYKFFPEAKTATGKKVGVKTDFEGIITGLNYTTEGPVLLVGNQSVKIKDVKRIVEPSLLKNNQGNQTTNVIQDKGATGASPDTEQRAGDAVPAPQAQLMNSVGMSTGMMAKLEKDSADGNAPANSQNAAPKTAQLKPETKLETSPNAKKAPPQNAHHK